MPKQKRYIVTRRKVLGAFSTCRYEVYTTGSCDGSNDLEVVGENLTFKEAWDLRNTLTQEDPSHVK